MASFPRARGADFKLWVKDESTFGTAPSGNYAQLPAFEFTMGAEAAIQADPALSATAEVTRDATGHYLGRTSVAGNAVVPVDLESFGYWLKLLFGPPSTSGSTDYTHTYVSGNQNSLPSAAIEKAFVRIGKYAMMTGVKANTLSLSASTDQRPRATIGLMAQDETFSGSSGAGTPTFAGMTQFHHRQYSVTLDGSAFGNCSALTINYNNGMEPFYDLNSSDGLAAIDEGLASCNGSATVRVSEDAVTLITNAATETSHSLVLKLEIGATKLIQFTAPNILLSRPVVGVSGPGGIDVTFNFEARYDSSAGEMLEAILKNQTASY